MQIQLNVRHDADVSDNSRREQVTISFPEQVRQPGETDEAWRARTLEMNQQAENLSRAVISFIENFERIDALMRQRPATAPRPKPKVLS